MKTFQRSLLSAAALCAGLFVQSGAQATALTEAIPPAPFADTPLLGTTNAARPELAGVVLEDVLTPFSFSGVTGTVQNRVVRETGSGTLDFYWKINTTSSDTGAGITAFRLGNFGYFNIIDGDWRSDGLGTVAPNAARLFEQTAHPEGSVNFLFDNGVAAGQESRFFFLRTDATQYAKTAQFDLLSGASGMSGTTATFAPAVPEPATYGLAFAGLMVVGALARRRSAK
ncbi:MAG: PEP-CTERM sorting domain-containing protein [Burkholderiales bacterium]|nr:PEP-CTERM sorting domain-containing protein [Burkholderiales bacterium]